MNKTRAVKENEAAQKFDAAVMSKMVKAETKEANKLSEAVKKSAFMLI